MDDSSKTMLGSIQKQHLLKWLSSSTAKIKFIVSSVMWNDDSKDATMLRRDDKKKFYLEGLMERIYINELNGRTN